jgi:hypothetical protein
MNLVFTICSVNYLASAKCLADSVLKMNPNMNFIYIIADKINNRVPKEFFEKFEYVEVENLGIPNLNELIGTYNIIEFNTAIKPFAVKYLVKKFNAKKIVYLDPDIIVFDSLINIFNELDKYDFILTPHILTPIVIEEYYPHQKGVLNTGVFNLGFIAINYNSESGKIIDWWTYHMRSHGHCNSLIGEFYDQKIMNLLPVFSNKVLIEKNPGYNVAGWNIHEREITKVEGKYFINSSPLCFYHYSGFVKDKSTNLISHYNHLKVDSNEHISEILDIYRNELKFNNHNHLQKEECYYKLKPNIHKSSKFKIYKHKLKKWLK